MMRSLLFALALVVMIAGAAPGGSDAYAQDFSGRPTDIHALFRVVGSFYNLDPDLLEAIARVESACDPYAVSPKGAQGLMQLMPETARRFRVENSFDPVDNALGAARFLQYLRQSFAATPASPADLATLLAAYNAGEAAVMRYGGIPPFPETQEYVRRVLITYLLGGQPPQLMIKPDHAPIRERPSSAHPRKARGKPLDPVLQQLAEIQDQRAAALRRSPDPALPAGVK